MWRLSIGTREILKSLFRRSINNLNLNDCSYNKQVDGLIRLKERKQVCEENWKWGIDSYETVAQKIAKKLKSREEFVAKKQIKQDKQELMNCLCIKRGILPATVSQLLTQIQDLLNKVNSMSDARELSILKQPASLERPTFPVNPLLFRVPGPCLAAILDCRMIRGILWVLKRFLNDHLLEKDELLLSSKIQRIWHPLLKNWGLTLQELQGEERVKRKENRWIRQSLHHTSKEEVVCWIILVERILALVWFIIWGFRFRNCIWEKLPDSTEFQSWKVNFKTEVCSKSADPHLTLHWIKEVEMVKSVDELVSSRSILVRTVRPRWSMDLSKILTCSRNSDRTTFYTPIETRVMPAPTSKRPEREFVVDSGAFTAHAEQKKMFTWDDLDTLRRSRNSTVVLTAHGEVHTNEKAQVYVHDLNLFVTEQLLEETPAVLSLGKLCEDHGCSFEWVSGQQPRLTKRGEDTCMHNGQLRTSWCSRVIHQF